MNREVHVRLWGSVGVRSRCATQLPLYRQQVIYQRSGVDISRSTLTGWFGAVGAALKPLAERLALTSGRHVARVRINCIFLLFCQLVDTWRMRGKRFT